MSWMYDAAYAPDLAKVRAAGGIAVNGYLTGDFAGTTSHAAAVRAAGLGFVATYEEGRSELVNATRATGQAVGRKILAALQRQGVPLDGSVAAYPSVDVSVASATACDQAWLGLRDVLKGKVSLRYYGEGHVGDHLFDAGLLDGKYWLAAPSSWPGYDGTTDTKRVCLVQLVGTNVPSTDKNQILGDPRDIGAWWPDSSPYAQEDPLADLTAAQLDQIARAVWNWDAPDGSAGLRIGNDPKNPTWAPGSALAWVANVLAQMRGGTDQIAQAVVAALPKTAGSLTESDVEAAVRKVFADAGTGVAA